MKTFAVIPAFNEEKTIKTVVKNTRKHCSVIVIDDGSKDRTAALAKEAGAVVFRHKTNIGYGKSLIDGINKAREMGADYIITMDSDGQHDAEEIPNFLEKLDEGFHIVSGSRFLGKKSWGTWKRELAIKMLGFQTRIFSGLDMTDIQSGFRGYNSDIFEHIQLENHGMGFSVELPIKAKKKGFRFVEIPIQIKEPSRIKTFWSAVRQGVSVGTSIIKYSLF